MTMKSWVKGALFLAVDGSGAASPLAHPVDFSYDPGMNDEAVPFAGASVTPNVVTLPTPSIQVNFIRKHDEDRVFAAMRWARSNLSGVRFYLYLDTASEATKYAYGMAIVKPSLQGAATSTIKGSFTLIPDDSGIWNDDALGA